MTKPTNDPGNTNNPVNDTLEKNSTLRPIEDQGINESLQDVVSDYWKDNQAPGFTGYKSKGIGAGEEEVKVDHTSTRNARKGRKERSDNRKNARKRKKQNKAAKVIKILLLVILLLILLGGGAFFGMKMMGEKAARNSDDSEETITALNDVILENGGKTVTYKGVNYTLNEDLSTILFIGVDREEYNESGEFGQGGQADTIILTTVNHKTGETRMIPISRNTMVEIDEYNDDGTYWRQNQIQIALAYAYGDGKEESCKNVAKAVSRFLFGMPVNQYVTLDMGCIGDLNDAIGGVTLELHDDFTEINPEYTAGSKVTLHGDEAQMYVRARENTIKSDDQDNNAARMERQKQFMNAFVKKVLSQTKSNPVLPLNLYNSLSDDLITDIKPSEVIYYASLLGKNGFNNTVLSIPGKVKHGEFTELYADKDALYEIILNTFYERQ